MDVIQIFTQSLCKPLLIYIIFVSALICYDITQLDARAILKNTLFLAIGSALIWTLCASGFEIAAWILLALPPFFFVGLLALLVLSQILKTEVSYNGLSQASLDPSSVLGPSVEQQRLVSQVERDMEGALSEMSKDCSVKPPVLCPTCTSTATSS
jgi:hypothetical protein